jgi:hypothetical protein
VSYHPLGWDADSINDEPSKQTISAAYNDTGRKFVELEVEGEPTGTPWDFKVYKQSHVYWYQDITHSPSETDFLLSFDLLYDSGPIGTRQDDDFQLRVEADWGIGNTILWSLDPVTIPARDIWYHTGPIPVSLAGVPTTFELRFVFEILEDRTLEGDRADFDGDWDNARYVRFHVDDISLTSADYMSPEDVNLRVDIDPVGETPVSEADGNGQALVNHSYWETSPQSIEILSNSSISFDYEARFVHVFRTGNTSWTTSESESGVAYSVDIDTSPVLTSYFYLPYHDNLESFSVELPHASDYENATVLDAASTDVTAFCTLSEGLVFISGDVLDSLGWWKVTLEAPNYAQEVKTQQYQMPSWENQTQFWSGDQIRSLAVIRTPTSVPSVLENVSVQWFQPNNTLWSEITINDGVDGVTYSPPLTLGPYNATPGEWMTTVFWNNGTELAYSETYFDVYHISSCSPVEAHIETETDSIVTCSVWFRDTDTNDYLLDDQCTVVGNWSTETIIFQRNLAKSWWEGDLDTSLVGRGNFTILVNVSRPYYSSSNCTVLVEIISPAVFSHLGPAYVDINLGSSHNAIFRYSYTDDTGIPGALIEVVSITGPMGGLSYGSAKVVPGQIGNYSIEFHVDIGGTYSVVVRASKEDHNTETVSFNIVASGIGTDLILLNGSSDVMNVGADCSLALHYRNSTGEGLSGAEVTIVDVVPITGLNFSTTQFHGNGTYTIVISSHDVGVFSITVLASLDGYDSQLAIFTLVVSPNPSTLSIDPVVYSISVDSNYTLIATFSNLTLHVLENASISVLSVDPASGLWFSSTTDLGSGNYSITLVPSEIGTYNLVLVGALENYQNSTTLFTLVVTEVSTGLRTSDGLVSGSTYFTDTFDILLLYERSDTGELVTGATIEISAVAGLEYLVVETPQGYLLTINPSVVGRWSLLLRASKSHHRNESMIFDFEVQEAITNLSGDGPDSILYLGGLYDFTLSFTQNDSLGIANATIIQTYRGIQGSPLVWIDNNDGTYSFTITADETGSYIVSIEFTKYGYTRAERTFSFNIHMHAFVIPNEHRLNNTYSLLQGENLYLSLRLTVGDTGEDLFDAVVSFLILETGTSGLFENHTDGSYTATIPVPLEAGTYSLRISLSKIQFVDSYIDIVLISEVDSDAIAMGYLITGVELSALFLGVVSVVYIGRRRQGQISARKRLELLSYRERFNDAGNIIGVLIIQRSGGLPIYSRIIKGGFDMSILGGFISAVSGFALEIGTEEKQWTAIPISDVVTAVRTEQLLCTLLTVDAPSPTLVKNLEDMSAQIGTRFDSDPDLLTTISFSREVASQYENELDQMFEDRFDSQLLLGYSSYDKNRSGQHPLIEEAIDSPDIRSPFLAIELVAYLAASGLDERIAYALVIDAVEAGFLIPEHKDNEEEP